MIILVEISHIHSGLLLILVLLICASYDYVFTVYTIDL